MAVATLNNWSRFEFPRMPLVRQAGSNLTTTQLQCNASGEKVAVNFQAPVAGDIDNVRVQWGSGGNASSSFDVSIYAVDANGYSTGAALAQTTGVSVNASTEGSTVVNFSTGATVTHGQRLVLELEWASGDIRFQGWLETSRYMGNATNHYTGSWASESYNLLWEFDIDGTYYTTCGVAACFDDDVYETRDTNDTNQYFGVKFQVPFDCKVAGMSGYWGFSNANADDRSEGLVRILDSSNVSLGATPTLGRWDGGAQANGQAHTALFTSLISLTRDTTYRMIIEPADAIYGMVMMTFERAAAADLHSMIGHMWDFTESSDKSSWTDDDTKMPLLSLLVAEVASEEGAGGGGTASIFGA